MDDDPSAETICGIGNRKNAAFAASLRSQGIAPFPGSLAVVEALHAAGIPLGVVSSSKNAEEVLAAAGIRSFFRVVIDGVVAEREHLASKPAADMFAAGATALGVDPARSIAVEENAKGMVVSVTLVPGRFRAHLARGRNFAGRTGCGVCGVETLDDLPQARPASGEPPPLAAASIARALAALERHQPLNDLTRAVHAAAWCDRDGQLLDAREDVGRHNALDKLIGALLARDAAAADGFVLITSRCSFEMVEKVARFGARWLVAISAPTSLALERATALGLGIVAIARGDAVTIFNGTLQAMDAKGAA